MTIADLFANASRLLLTIVAGLALVDLLRHRDRMRLEIAIMLGSLGIAVAVGMLPEDIRTHPWVARGAAMALITQPYLAMRLVTFFRPVPRVFMWMAVVGMIASGLGVALDTAPIETIVALAIIAYFIVFSCYAAWAFLQGVRTSGGAFRGRMGSAAMASGLLAMAFVFAAIGRLNPGITPITNTLFPALIAVFYYLAFLSPHWLRQAWQLPELHRFLQTVVATNARERVSQAGEQLSRTVTRLTGGTASAVLLWEADRECLVTHATDRKVLEGAAFPAAEGVAGRTWATSAPLLATNLMEMGGTERSIAQALESKAILSVPILGAGRTWGVLLTFRPQGRLFSQDLLELMGLLAAQYAMILENDALLQEQEGLVAHLQRSNEEMEAFSYSISHDLRRPLRAIDGFSDAILQDYGADLPPEGTDYLNRVRAAAQSMGHLIDELLKLSRLSREVLRPESLDLSAVATEIAGGLREREPTRQVQFLIPTGLMGQGDPALIRLVLENLLENAWKFTSQQENATIEFGAAQGDGDRTFFVKDNGVGFESAFADKLFLPFQRLHSPQEFPGTGIGLATVQWVIRRHGGRVWAEGEAGRGARFYFTLPQKG